jgi:shikimate dehydrogenase
MKKYIVIGNPVTHSFSPKIHNYWFKQNDLDYFYEKRQIKKEDLESVIETLRSGEVDGINVTLPFKQAVIPLIDELTPLAKKAQSVNTILKKKNIIIGDNTDINGFKLALEHIKYKAKGKKAFILGAGGVSPSIIIALEKLGIKHIAISNRTISKAENLKKIYPALEIIEWGKSVDFDIAINATSLGLDKEDSINIDIVKNGSKKLFYDVIYNPEKTKFLVRGEEKKNEIENGKMMFIYQAQLSFEIWHGFRPKIDNKIINLFNYD